MNESSTPSRAAPAAAARRIVRALPDPEATAALGRELALFARPGDWILLHGELGAGKSALARAFIRALGERYGEFEVPSPTFTLAQTYDFTRPPVVHADLYRIADPFEAEELGLEELARDHALVIEWPDRLPSTPPERLDIHLEYAGAGRRATLAGHGRWAETLARMEAIAAFLDAACQGRRIARRFLQGDASSRRYEAVRCGDGPEAILMDMPERPDGPPIRDGLSYDQIAGLARHIRAVEAVNGVLREKGYAAPRTLALDLDAGLMLQEYLRGEVFGACYAAGNMRAPMAAAVDLLADMARRDWPERVALPDGSVHAPRRYDARAMEVEVRLQTDWFWPRIRGAPAPAEAVEEYARVWRRLFRLLDGGRFIWTLRDFHSPNLIWRPGESGLARVGLIDTQDAVFGPAAYDLASLLQDARIFIPAPLRAEMLERYLRARAAREADFDAARMRLEYSLMGAQRACKVLGIFVRLNDRDGKPAYLPKIPHVAACLADNLKTTPELAELAAWFARRLPEALEPDILKERFSCEQGGR